MTDPIADMLTRIRNANMAKLKEVLVPNSKIKFAIAQILEKQGYVAKVAVVDGLPAQTGEDAYKYIQIKLKYENKKPVISHIKRVSKVGCRVYAGNDRLPRVLNNLGIAILSTSKGVMTNSEARRLKIGGEVLCEIY